MTYRFVTTYKEGGRERERERATHVNSFYPNIQPRFLEVLEALQENSQENREFENIENTLKTH